jgi:NitT/TauT family transport system substrate-binding protein
MTARFLPSRRGAMKAIAGLTLAALATTAAAQQTTRIRFQLDWRFEGPAALFVLPVAKGYFKQEGLDVVVDAGNGSGGTVTRVASGAYDMGFADIAAMIEFLAANQGIPGARMQAVYMLYDYSPAAVLALKKSGITKPADLNGKTMGAPVFDAGRKAFPLFVKANNLDSSKIKWTSMDPPLRETMLARGEVDAITGFYFTSLLNLNARGVKDEEVVVLKYPDYGVNLYSNTVIANQKFIDANPQAITGFLRALTKGIRDVVADPDGAIQYVKQRDPLIDEALEKRRLRLALDTVIATPAFKANGIGAVNKLKLEDTVAQVVTAFGLKTTPNTDTIFNSSFLPSAGERQVFRK